MPLSPSVSCRVMRHLAVTGSTNADLAKLALSESETPEGFVLLADRQTAGKGRQGRSWTAPPDSGLTFSVLFRPAIPPLQAATFPLVVGFAVAEAVQPLVPEAKVALKWPNDLQINGKKLCGILCEMRADGDKVRHLIAGIGLNVNLDPETLPPETASIATSLRAATGRSFDRMEVLTCILSSLAAAYTRWLSNGFADLLPDLLKRDALLGKRITVDRGTGPVSGTATGIAPDGALLLARDDGTVESVYSGDAHIRRDAI